MCFSPISTHTQTHTHVASVKAWPILYLQCCVCGRVNVIHVPLSAVYLVHVYMYDGLRLYIACRAIQPSHPVQAQREW